MKRTLLLAGLLSSSLLLISQTFTFRDPAWVAGLNPVASAAFQPTDVSGCTIWFAADQTELTGYTNGQSVSIWTNHGSASCTVTQGVVIRQPLFTNNAINGRPALIFDGTNSGLQNLSVAITNIVQTNYFTFFSVQAGFPKDTKLTVFVWAPDNNNMFRLQRDTDGSTYLYHSSLGAAGRISFSDPAFTNMSGQIWCGARDGSSKALLSRNATNVASASSLATNLTAGTSGFYLGLPNNAVSMHGWIAELIVYNTFLSPANSNSVMTYLNGKYNVF